MVQETALASDAEVQYVPDVICPSCSEIIHLPLPTYSWYQGEVGCKTCQSTVSVKIGEWGEWGAGPIVPRTIPFRNNSGGGILLEQPVLVRPGRRIPTSLVQGMESSAISEPLRRAMRTAIRHYERGDYPDAAVRCRYMIQEVLMTQGTEEDRPAVMISKAKETGRITDLVEPLCRAVVALGNRGAHPPDDPGEPVTVTRNDALLAIAMSAKVLRNFYLD